MDFMQRLPPLCLHSSFMLLPAYLLSNLNNIFVVGDQFLLNAYLLFELLHLKLVFFVLFLNRYFKRTLKNCSNVLYLALVLGFDKLEFLLIIFHFILVCFDVRFEFLIKIVIC